MSEFWCSLAMTIFIVLFSASLIITNIFFPLKNSYGSDLKKLDGREGKNGSSRKPKNPEKKKKRFKEIYCAEHTSIKVIIVACFDSGFQLAFRRLINEELKLESHEFVLISVAGGPGALAHPIKCHNDFLFLERQINFCLKHFRSIEKIILLGHEDCEYYNEIIELPNKEKKDLKQAGKLTNVLSQKPVELFFASFSGPGQTGIMFEEVEPE